MNAQIEQILDDFGIVDKIRLVEAEKAKLNHKYIPTDKIAIIERTKCGFQVVPNIAYLNPDSYKE